MSGDDLKRAGAVAGIGGFVLVLMLLLAFAEPGRAMLWALVAGLGVGTGVVVAGSLAMLSRPVVPPAPRVSAVVGEPAEPEPAPEPDGASLAAALAAVQSPAGSAVPGPAAPAGEPSQATSLHDTSSLTVDDVIKAQDLHQTVRLDQMDVQYVMPELNPEDVIKEREGIDEAFLKAGIGLEENTGARENTIEKQPGTGG